MSKSLKYKHLNSLNKVKGLDKSIVANQPIARQHPPMVPQPPLLPEYEIRRRLRLLMQRPATNLAELARRVDVHRWMFYAIANGRCPVSLLMQRKLSECLSDVKMLEVI